MNPGFIIVDDDPVNNMICRYTIGKVFPNADCKSFELPLEGLKFISSEYDDIIKQHATTLILDINMPLINGWDFLEQFSKMDKHIHDQFTIYIVSSSIDPSDKEKAKANRFVKGYLEKPLKAESIESMV